MVFYAPLISRSQGVCEIFDLKVNAYLSEDNSVIYVIRIGIKVKSGEISEYLIPLPSGAENIESHSDYLQDEYLKHTETRLPKFRIGKLSLSLSESDENFRIVVVAFDPPLKEGEYGEIMFQFKVNEAISEERGFLGDIFGSKWHLNIVFPLTGERWEELSQNIGARPIPIKPSEDGDYEVWILFQRKVEVSKLSIIPQPDRYYTPDELDIKKYNELLESTPPIDNLRVSLAKESWEDQFSPSVRIFVYHNTIDASIIPWVMSPLQMMSLSIAIVSSNKIIRISSCIFAVFLPFLFALLIFPWFKKKLLVLSPLYYKFLSPYGIVVFVLSAVAGLVTYYMGLPYNSKIAMILWAIYSVEVTILTIKSFAELSKMWKSRRESSGRSLP